MKKTIIAIILATLVCTGCVATPKNSQNTSSHTIEYIGAGNAKEIALADSSASQSQVSELSAELDSKNGRDYYNVSYLLDGKDYRYEIDALTGSILSVSADENTVNTSESSNDKTPATETAPTLVEDYSQKNTNASADNTPSTVTSNPVTSSNPGNSKSTTPQNNTSGAAPTLPQSNTSNVTPSQPLNNTANVTPSQPLNNTANAPVQHQNNAANSGAIISETEAKNAILARIPGATTANFVSFHIDRDDGRLEYEGKVIYDNKEYEFEIDAYSGAFRDWDVEFVWD